MPRYDYKCRDCKTEFVIDMRLRIKEKYDKDGLRCPDCGGRCDHQMSAPGLSSGRVTAGC